MYKLNVEIRLLEGPEASRYNLIADKVTESATLVIP